MSGTGNDQAASKSNAPLEQTLSKTNPELSGAHLLKQAANRFEEPFRFLDLPTEIRLSILELLLWAPQGLSRLEGREKPRELQPQLCLAILRCCKKIYREGTPILYKNAIQVLITWEAEKDEERYRTVIMGRELPWHHPLPIEVSPRLSKLSVMIQARPCDLSSTRQMNPLAATIRIFAYNLGASPSWNDVTFEMRVAVPPGTKQKYEKCTFDDARHWLLKPLSYVRNLQHASISGDVDVAYASRLSYLMTSNLPVVDMPRMVAALDQYTKYITQDRYLTGISVPSERRMSWDDTKNLCKFLETRSTYLQLIDRIYERSPLLEREARRHIEERENVFRFDPPVEVIMEILENGPIPVLECLEPQVGQTILCASTSLED